MTCRVARDPGEGQHDGSHRCGLGLPRGRCIHGDPSAAAETGPAMLLTMPRVIARTASRRSALNARESTAWSLR